MVPRRILLGSCVLYKAIWEWSLHWFIFAGAVGLYAVSAIWGLQIVLMVVKSVLRVGRTRRKAARPEGSVSSPGVSGKSKTT